MEIKLLAHTKLADEFVEELTEQIQSDLYYDHVTDGQAVALTAIRTCYSHNTPSIILEKEYEKYFKKAATDGKGGTDADRLIRHIVNSGHRSTIEHINFTFSIEGVSRSLLTQLTRHRIGFSYSVQSQRYVSFGTNNKSQGFNYIIPETIKEKNVDDEYNVAMEYLQKIYDYLRKNGVPAEDARLVLPNAATCNLVMTINLRSLLDFYSKRSTKSAQWEIRDLAEKLKEQVIKVEPWTEPFFNTK